jgi:hypothetical protein
MLTKLVLVLTAILLAVILWFIASAVYAYGHLGVH